MSPSHDFTPFGPSALSLKSKYFKWSPLKHSTKTSQVCWASSKERPEIVSDKSNSSISVACCNASIHETENG